MRDPTMQYQLKQEVCVPAAPDGPSARERRSGRWQQSISISTLSSASSSARYNSIDLIGVRAATEISQLTRGSSYEHRQECIKCRTALIYTQVTACIVDDKPKWKTFIHL